MKKLVDTIKALEFCTVQAVDRDCDHCPIGFGEACALNLKRDALELLKAQEARHRLEVHNIGNVDIPEGVSWVQFQAVMENVVDALEHTDRGESWPYEEAKA